MKWQNGYKKQDFKVKDKDFSAHWYCWVAHWLQCFIGNVINSSFYIHKGQCWLLDFNFYKQKRCINSNLLLIFWHSITQSKEKQEKTSHDTTTKILSLSNFLTSPRLLILYIGTLAFRSCSFRQNHNMSLFQIR